MSKPPRQPVPHYKFRLLCKQCNSDLHTGVDVLPRGMYGAMLLWCDECGVSADSLDEEFEPVRDQ
jgi:RNase P subunit RPR2